jgi:hypothetical protein
MVNVAEELLTAFYTEERDGTTRVILHTDHPHYETASSMVFQANKDLGHDFAYAAVYEVLGEIANVEYTTADEIRDNSGELIEGLPDVYNNRLSSWLAESLSHGELCNEALSEFGGETDNIWTLLALGQEWGYRYAVSAIADNWPAECDECEGTGELWDNDADDAVSCPECGGSGLDGFGVSTPTPDTVNSGGERLYFGE